MFALIISQVPVKGPVASIKRVDADCSLLEQAVRESADVAPQVGRFQAFDRQAQALDGVLELSSASAHIFLFLGASH